MILFRKQFYDNDLDPETFAKAFNKLAKNGHIVQPEPPTCDIWEHGWNCYGFVQWAKGWQEELFWEQHEIADLLDQKCKPINEEAVKIGDIVALTCEGEENFPWADLQNNRHLIDLFHVAIVCQVKPEICFIHKPGGLHREVCNKDGMVNQYGYVGDFEYNYFREVKE